MKKFFKCLLPLILIFGFQVSKSIAQSEEPDTVTIVVPDEDSIIYESPVQIELKAVSMVRFSSTAKAYLRWSAPTVSVTGYAVRYKLLGASNWTSVSNSTIIKTLSSLQLDTLYNVEILPTGVASPSDYRGAGIISTHPQTEPINVSSEFYNELAAWFANESESRSFCELIDESDIDLFEKLSFLQVYVFDNEAFTDAGSSSSFSDWYPSRSSALTDAGCLPVFEDGCNCHVITKGGNYGAPGILDDDNGKLYPKVVQKIAKNGHKRTYVDRFESGAAKFIGLRQDEQVGMSYAITNLTGGDDNTSATSAVSEIQFVLGCIVDSDGGWTTHLPESCNCDKPLTVSYQYTTSLLVSAAKKSCLWSRGAAAQAEDVATVVALDWKTGALTALDAGKYMVGQDCSSGWNPDWWINLLNVAATVAGYFETSSSGNNIPTQTQINDFIDAITVLIGTPFANQSGECGDTEGSQVLVQGPSHLSLVPNSPIRISLFSSYYAKVRGYGCWKAKAGIASDYYLLGVVESEDSEDPECCSSKFANYIVGSQQFDSAPTPAQESDVECYAFNSIDNRIDKVALDLNLYGSWYRHHENELTGIIDDLWSEFAQLYGPDCFISYTPFQQGPQNNPVFIERPNQLIQGNSTLNIESQKTTYGVISIFDISGRQMKTLYSGRINPGFNQVDINTNQVPSGSYIINCEVDGQSYNYPIFIQN